MSTEDEKETAARGDEVVEEKPADEDEPVFILRGLDPFAPMLIEHWADMTHKAGGTAVDEKVTSAVLLAEQMRAYQRRPQRTKAPE
jgi:hypothetical protein